MSGSLALVGSGEYLPGMAEFEQSLIEDGLKNQKAPRFVQIPTAAG
ncbi:MAG: peptidase, partial [Actinobacteria bacterium]|nr:peptidase [Actinomycetota bacterium]